MTGAKRYTNSYAPRSPKDARHTSVYPIIEESEKLDLRNATEMYENLRTQIFPEISVGLLHGRMKPREKESVIECLRRQ
jgi:ATP-dependent DNA helicase RecG